MEEGFRRLVEGVWTDGRTDRGGGKAGIEGGTSTGVGGGGGGGCCLGGEEGR